MDESDIDRSGKIESLPSSTVRLIGSGQVITSVFSVVKELLENSVDAGATAIDIKLENYGLEKIEIIDNGCGISVIDIPYMAKRHYTSKLTSTNDLLSLNSYGFRGEALASLCSVSNVSITSKTKTDDVGYTYSVNKDGDVTDKKPSHLGTGTSICARNLFSNLPVRKQYYSNAQRRKDDFKRIEEILIVYGILKPCLRLTLKHGKETIWQKTSMDTIKSSLQHSLGRQVVNNMVHIERDLEEPKASLEVFIPKAGTDVKSLSRSTHDRTFVVVNNRPVHIQELTRILRSYYCNAHSCETKRFPLCYVSITLPSHEVDVNVDPNKTIVFIQNLKEVCNFLEGILLEVYGPLDNVPSWHYEAAEKSISESRNDRKDSTTKVLSDHQQLSGPVRINIGKTTAKERKTIGSNKDLIIEDDELVSMLDSVESHVNTRQEKYQLHPVKANTVLGQSKRDIPSEKKDDQINVDNDEVLINELGSQAFFQDLLDEEIDNESLFEKNVNAHSTQGQTRNNTVQKWLADNSISKTFNTTSYHENIEIISEENNSKTKKSSKLETLKLSVSTNEDESESNNNNNIERRHIIIDRSEPSVINWSKGQSLLDSQGQIVQPVQILVPNQTSRKRPSSPDASFGTCGPSKVSKTKSLPSDQLTLVGMMSPRAGGVSSPRTTGSPHTPFTLFCLEKKKISPELFAGKIKEEIAQCLKTSWIELKEEEKLKYREQRNQQRANLQSDTPKEPTKSKSSNKAQPPTIQDQMADLASQSQKLKKHLKKRFYKSDKKIQFSFKQLKKTTLLELEDLSNVEFSIPTLIGQIKSCNAMVMGHSSQLSLVNVSRLSETMIYRKLLGHHHIKTNPCDPPIVLDDRKIGPDLWPTFETLVKENYTDKDTFTVKDKRVAANGFNIECKINKEGKLTAKIMGICDFIPAYNLFDFEEILKTISSNPQVILSQCRPLKAQFYLQGEAVRISLEDKESPSPSDLTNFIYDPDIDLTSLQCVHDKPVFKPIYDLTDL